MTQRAFERALMCFLILWIALMVVCSARAQTYSPFLNPKAQFFNDSGAVCAGCKLYTYTAGTSNALATYSATDGTANANPVVLDSAGRATIYLGAAAYKFVLKTSGDSTLWTQDNIVSLTQVHSGTGFRPNTAGGADVGTTALPVANIWLGDAATNNAKITGTFAAARVFTLPDLASTTFAMLGGTQTFGGSKTFSEQVAISKATGTAPLSITSTTAVANLTAQRHPLVYYCGAAGSTTCAQTLATNSRIAYGWSSLASASPSTVTITALPFTDVDTVRCVVSNATTQANPIKVVIDSATQITITGPNTVTDAVGYICVGQ